MLQFTYTITDELGIHARPAGLIAKACGKYPCDITIEKDGKCAKGKKLFELMSLCAKCGDTITISFSGEQEQTALDDVRSVVEEYL